MTGLRHYVAHNGKINITVFHDLENLANEIKIQGKDVEVLKSGLKKYVYPITIGTIRYLVPTKKGD